jgi:CRP/FNR family transcriptional regulator, cyclic AMP receptor protein
MDNPARSSGKMSLDQALSVARSAGWLSRQGAEFQALICANARLRSFQKNESLFHYEDEAPEIYCLVSGTAVILVVHPVQGLLAGHIFHPGDWFGEPAALGRRPRLSGVQARGPCQALTVTRKVVDGILQANAGYSANFFDLMAGNAEAYMLHAIDLMIQDPKMRLCSRLLTLGGRRINYLPNPPVSIPLSQDEVALTSCLSRKTVNHFLGELVDKGICELRYREVVILDVQALHLMQEA